MTTLICLRMSLHANDERKNIKLQCKLTLDGGCAPSTPKTINNKSKIIYCWTMSTLYTLARIDWMMTMMMKIRAQHVISYAFRYSCENTFSTLLTTTTIKKIYFYFAEEEKYWCCCCERTFAHWVDAFVQPQKAMIAMNSQYTASAQHSPLDARETREKKYINSQQVTCASSSILIVPANIFHIHTHTHTRSLTASHLWIEVEQTTTKLPNENSNRIRTHRMASNVRNGRSLRHVCCLISECIFTVCMTGECHQRHKSLECTDTHTWECCDLHSTACVLDKRCHELCTNNIFVLQPLSAPMLLSLSFHIRSLY